MGVDASEFFLRSTAGDRRQHTKSLRRWRAAVALVFSSRALAARTVARRGDAEALLRRRCRNSSCFALDAPGAASELFSRRTASPLTEPARRWRAAFAVIYSGRALLAVARRGLAEILSRSQSYVAIPVHDDEDAATTTALEGKLSLVNRAHLSEIVKGKRLDGLRDLGGVEAVAASLATHLATGIAGDDDSLRLRERMFGTNTYKKPPTRGFHSFVWEALRDPMLIILLACAALSLGFGIKEHGVKEGWYDGVSILVAVFLVVSVSAVSNFRQARRFAKLSDECGNIRVHVVRDGRRQEVSIFDVVVGDVVCLQIGDQVPADGLFLDGHSLQVDESSMTGESDQIAVDKKRNPFVTSGTKVADGFASVLVTSVGMDTTWGEMMSSITRDTNEPTPLQERLQKLTSSIGKIGTTVAVLVLAVLLIRYFTGSTPHDDGKPKFDRKKVSFDSLIERTTELIKGSSLHTP